MARAATATPESISTPAIQPLSFSIKGLSAATGLPISSIFKAIARGDLVAAKDGRRNVILREDAEAFLRVLKVRAARGE